MGRFQKTKQLVLKKMKENIHYENKTRFEVYRAVSTGQWYLETDKLLVRIDEATFNRIANASKGKFQNRKKG